VIWVAYALWLLAAVLAITNLVVGVRAPGVFDTLDTDPASGMTLFATLGAVGVSYATAGVLILRQRIRHLVGWLLLVSGPLFITVFSMAAVGSLLIEAGHPAAPWVILGASYGWVPALLLAGPVLALIFPDGRLPGPRWRVAVMVIGAVLAATLFTVLLRPGALGPEPNAPENPLAVDFLPDWVFAALDVSGALVLIGTLAIGVGAVVTRFRRAGPDERQQLKWFVFAVVVCAVVLPSSFFIESDALFVVAVGVLILIPTSVLIAISRYRLYEIDTLINRTLVYVPLVGIVAGLYAACVVLFQRLFVATTGDTSDAAAIISALILAAVFTPIRKSIEGVVDRRFKPAAPATAAAPAGIDLEDPRFDAAVERVVRRVLAERRPSR
jgi:hypothetical protein